MNDYLVIQGRKREDIRKVWETATIAGLCCMLTPPASSRINSLLLTASQVQKEMIQAGVLNLIDTAVKTS